MDGRSLGKLRTVCYAGRRQMSNQFYIVPRKIQAYVHKLWIEFLQRRLPFKLGKYLGLHWALMDQPINDSNLN